MTATQSTSAARGRSAPRSSSESRAFTLTELLVVIALIVMLITLLLAALKAVQNKARETRTSATMRAFGNACDAFQLEQGFYPGVVPENILAYEAEQNGGRASISGTENAILHLTGGFIREADVSEQEWDNPPAGDWYLYVFQSPTGPYRVKIDLGKIGQGPIINGKAYAPYFTPGEKEFAATTGQAGTGMGPPRRPLPDVLDAWGQPIIYLRRMRSIGPLTAPSLADNPQFHWGAMGSYTQSVSLGRLGRSQLFILLDAEGNEVPNLLGSIFNSPDADVWDTLGMVLQHPSLPSQARGAFMLLSAGPDGVFFSRADGPGSPGNVVDDLSGYGPSVIDEYDDVLIFGGD